MASHVARSIPEIPRLTGSHEGRTERVQEPENATKSSFRRGPGLWATRRVAHPKRVKQDRGGPSFAYLPFAKGGVLLFSFLSWLRPKRFLAQAQGAK
jgi:hypothetical protein